MYACMYVCMYVFMYDLCMMYVCMYVCMYVFCTDAWICMHLSFCGVSHFVAYLSCFPSSLRFFSQTPLSCTADFRSNLLHALPRTATCRQSTLLLDSTTAKGKHSNFFFFIVFHFDPLLRLCSPLLLLSLHFHRSSSSSPSSPFVCLLSFIAASFLYPFSSFLFSSLCVLGLLSHIPPPPRVPSVLSSSFSSSSS